MSNPSDLTPAAFLALSIERIESKSIRAWALTPHNYPIFLGIAENTLKNKPLTADPALFAAWMVCEAIGA